MEDLIKRLKTDPVFLMEVIVWNNYQEVLTNFTNSTDAEINNEESLIIEMGLFINDGFGDIVAKSLLVPFDEENANKELLAAYIKLRDSSGNMFNGLYNSVQKAIDRENEVAEQTTTSKELTEPVKTNSITMYSETKIVGDIKNVLTMALIIIVALYVATKIKLK